MIVNPLQVTSENIPTMNAPGFRKHLARQFTRVTSSVAFIPQVDGLRCLALLLVFGHHAIAFYLEDTHRLGTNELPQDWAMIATRSPLIAWALHLAFGVQIFFVISGFILALPFARYAFQGYPSPSTKKYLLRRIVRLEPPYVINLVFLFFFVIVHHRAWYETKYLFHLFLPHLLASIFYIHLFVFKTPSWVNGVAWTLEVELQFYLLLPLLALLFRLHNLFLRRVAWTALIFVAAFIAQVGLPLLHSIRLDLSLAHQLQFFLAGILLADIYLDPPYMLRVNQLAADAVGFGACGLLIYILHWQPKLAWLEPLLTAIFFFGVFNSRWLSWLFSARALTIPGVMCYSVYLYHIFLIKLLLPWTIVLLSPVHSLWLDVAVQYGVLLPPVLLVSGVLFLAIERPFVFLSHFLTARNGDLPPAEPAEAMTA